MEVCLLGALEVVAGDGSPLPIAGVRLRTLLIALALRCGEVVSDDALIDAIWGDDPPSRSSNALQRQVSTLRRALGSQQFIERRGSGYALTIDSSAIDVLRFDSTVELGLDALRNGDAAGARELLDDALQMWRGDALADVSYADFAQPEIARLMQARAVALEGRIDADLALGRDAELISELAQLVRQHPLREHLRAQLMLALARAGRPAEALRAYQDARRTLGEELGVEPSQELRALETAILREEDNVSRPERADAFARARTNLRTPLTTIVGRDADLASLGVRMQEHRLVTLVGPGGVGKSRLAVEAGRHWLATRDTEVWIVELAAIARNDDVIPAILRALDLPEAGDTRADSRRLLDYLCMHAAVLILDNCEHVVGDVARVAQDLLESCENLRICATSREGLAVPSEVVIPVAPLALDDAVTLFAERARTADASFELTNDSSALRTSVADVCTRVDGLPLAIELAAARLRAMSIAELVSGLDDRFRVLNRGARTSLPRQQTLRAVVDWSYDLLFDDERRVFERLSVFRGSCSLAAARVVCADADISSDDVAELVTRLIDKSLVRAEQDEVDGYTRCHMLQTLVDYGRDRLEASGDATRVYEAHTAYYRDFAVRSVAALRGVKQRGWLRAVTANLANLRAAFDVSVRDNDTDTAGSVAGCLGWYWWFTGRASEGRQWLAIAASGTGPVEQLTRARVLAWSAFTGAPGFVGWSDARPARALDDERPRGPLTFTGLDRMCRAALDVYGRHPEANEERAGVELALSVAYSTLGEFVRAHELAADAERVLAATPDSTTEGGAMRAFAAARRAFLEDDYLAAEDAFRASADLFAASGIEAHETFALRYAARLASLRGDTAAAVRDLDRAIAIARELSLTGFANMLLADLAHAFATAGDFERARSTLIALLVSAREVGFKPGIAEALAALALVEWRAGEHESAAAYAHQGIEAAEDAQLSEAKVYCATVLGLVSAALGECDFAREQLVRALEDARSLAPPQRAVGFVLQGYAMTVAGSDDVRAARLLGAADAFGRAPGSAAGAAFATGAIDADGLLAQLTKNGTSEALATAFAAGGADPEGVLASL